MMKKLMILTTLLLALSTIEGNAQCKVTNNYFQAGEELTYDLYVKFAITVKAGTSSLKTVSTKYNGKDAYKMSLIANSSGLANSIYSLDDTLSTYTTKDLTPLAFQKLAHEKGDFTNENMTYTYGSGGNVTVKTKRVKNGELKFDETINASSCVYDMVSVVFYARTLDYSSMKKGDEKRVDFVSGKKKSYMIIEHQGIENIKANDGKTYSCIKLVLSLSANVNKNAFEDRTEAMKVYITNDNNRIPVRLDSKLKRGSTRAMLKGYKGTKHAVSAK